MLRKIINFFRGNSGFKSESKRIAFKSLKSKNKNWLIRALIVKTEENLKLKRHLKKRFGV